MYLLPLSPINSGKKHYLNGFAHASFIELGFLIFFKFHRKLYISVFNFLNDNRVNNFIKWGLFFLLNFILIKFQHKNVSRIIKEFCITFNQISPKLTFCHICYCFLFPSFVSISVCVHITYSYTRILFSESTKL